jgi:hypothetical protein
VKITTLEVTIAPAAAAVHWNGGRAPRTPSALRSERRVAPDDTSASGIVTARMRVHTEISSGRPLADRAGSDTSGGDDQIAMPPQQRCRPHEESVPQRAGQQSHQAGQHRPVGPVHLRP